MTVVLSACGSAPATPSSISGPAMGEFDGVWTGKTAQGLPASFTVSSRTITAITVPYDFSGCSGVKSFSNLSVSISQSSGPMPVQVTYTSGPIGGPDLTLLIAAAGSRVGFSYTSGPPGLPDHTQIIGYFNSSTAVDGIVLFTGYPGCANQIATWTASLR